MSISQHFKVTTSKVTKVGLDLQRWCSTVVYPKILHFNNNGTSSQRKRHSGFRFLRSIFLRCSSHHCETFVVQRKLMKMKVG